MSTPSRASRRADVAMLAVALALYAAEASWAIGAHRDWINPDAIAYARNAAYWTEGRFADAISGYWSPLLSWTAVPLVGAGLEPLRAALVAAGVWGAALVVAAWRLIVVLDLLPRPLALVALALIAESTVRWGATIFPDVALAACLTAAASVLARPGLPDRPRSAVIAGAWGGLAFLAKAYGLPFFLVFLPATLLAFHAPWIDGPAPSGSRRAILRAWGFAMLAFAVVAGPWIAALSVKFEEPTIGFVGKINHAIVGPRDPSRDALWSPVPGRITVWEIPETRDYGYWSPFENAESFRWQVRYTWTNLKDVRGSIARFDWLSLGLVLAVVGPFVAVIVRDPPLLRFTSWILVTFTVFGGGFAFVYFTFRYTASFLKPLAVVAVLAVVWRLAREVSASGLLAPRRARLAGAALLAVAIASFAAHLNVPFDPYRVEEVNGTAFDDITVDSAPHRELARTLETAGLRGPVASNFYWGGMFTAYWLDAPFVGSPAGADAVSVRRELDAVGARIFLVNPAWPLAQAFAAEPGWRPAMRVEAAGQPILVYVSTPRMVAPRL